MIAGSIKYRIVSKAVRIAQGRTAAWRQKLHLQRKIYLRKGDSLGPLAGRAQIKRSASRRLHVRRGATKTLGLVQPSDAAGPVR